MSVYNLAFRAGIPLGALTLGKLIPFLGVSVGLACFGLALTAVVSYFILAMKNVATFQKHADSVVGG